MNGKKAIGRVKGPGKERYEYTFVTPDNRHSKIGEFVYYELDEKKVLCRIIRRQPLRVFPDAFLAKPEIDPSKVASMINFNSSDCSLYLISAMIIGYWDNGFVNPRIQPEPGTEICIAENDYLEKVLNKIGAGKGSLFIGSLLNRGKDEVKVYMDTNELVSTHLAVLAATGSGKSYTVGVILEELIGRNNRGQVLVFDPHGEYSTLIEMIDLEKAKGEGFIPKVKVLSPNDIKIRLSDLEFADYTTILANATDKMMNLLKNSLFALRSKGRFTYNDLLMQVTSPENKKSDADEATIRGLQWRLDEYIKNKSIFDDYKHTSLDEIVSPGQITILQLNEMSEIDQQLLTSVLLSRLLKARVMTEKKEVNEKSEFYIPRSVFVVLEEAHRFSPGGKESRAKNVIKTILAEGRKFGIGCCLISQRPGKLDSDALSQCMSQVIMKTINPSDQSNIKESLENVTEEMIAELPALSKGQAIISGRAINTPLIVGIRERQTTHGGTSKDHVAEWFEEMKEENVEKKKMESAPLKDNKDEMDDLFGA